MSSIYSATANNSLVSYGTPTTTKNDFSSMSLGTDYQSLWNQATSGLTIQQKTELFANTFDPNASATSDQNRLNNAAAKFRQLSSLSSGADQTKFTSYVNAISAFSNLLDNQSSISSQSITETAKQNDITNLISEKLSKPEKKVLLDSMSEFGEKNLAYIVSVISPCQLDAANGLPQQNADMSIEDINNRINSLLDPNNPFIKTSVDFKENIKRFQEILLKNYVIAKTENQNNVYT